MTDVTIIEPTVGRVVWFRPGDDSRFHYFSAIADKMAALVVYVHGTRMVNLAVFDPNGVPCAVTSVPLRQEGDAVPQGFYCEWMPYQVGQARKNA